jgi:V/A-type H+-transporting ATPase subunit I
MAILRMAKAILGTPPEHLEQTLASLQELGVLDARPFEGLEPAGQKNGSKKEHLEKASESLLFLDLIAPRKMPFTANFAWPRPIVDPKNAKKLLSGNPEAIISELLGQKTRLEQIKTELAKLKERVNALSKFTSLSIPTHIESSEVDYFIGAVQPGREKQATALNGEKEFAIWASKGVVVMASLKSRSTEAKELLAKFGFAALPFPPSEKTVMEQLQETNSQIASLEKEKQSLEKEAGRNDKDKRLSIILWMDNEETAQRLEEVPALSSEFGSFVIGYVPAKDAKKFEQTVSQKCPWARLVLLDVPEDEEPPVKLKNNPYSTPFETVTSMYGMPSYRGIDSTFIVSILFPIFFGFCFGDALYGIMLVLFSLWYLRTFKTEEGGKRFFRLFIICGISTFIIGALTGSWGGNLIASDGVIAVPALVALKDKITLLDPLKQTITFFVLTLFIGIGSQFIGILIAAWMNIRQGKWLDALLDQASWIIFLSGLVMFGIDFLGGNLVGAPKTVMFVLILTGAFFLVFFQGRGSKNFFGRIGLGLVSLYGIMGGYGTASFIGDIMSYSRLMALGLTSSIVALAFNKMAMMIGFSNPFGSIFTIVILVFGHLLNFFLNIIGSFVHPARLTFLEFYSRFYSGGGRSFSPLEKSEKRIKIMEEKA